MGFKMNTYGLLVMIGAIIALVAVFLAWISGFGESVSGWKVYSELKGLDWRINIPLIVTILAIVCIVFALLEALEISFNDLVQKIMVMVIGALIVVLALLFIDGHYDMAGIGLYLEIVAGIILIVVPLLAILKVLPE